MNLRSLLKQALLLTFVALPLRTGLASDESVLRFEAIHYGTLGSIVQHRIIHEKINKERFELSIHEYRLDRSSASTKLDSLALGTTAFPISGLDTVSIDFIKRPVLAGPTAKALEGHHFVPRDERETIAGLPSRKFVVMAGGIEQFKVWLADPPKELNQLVKYEVMEFPIRNAAFVVEEQLRNMIRLLLVRDGGSDQDSLDLKGDEIITRIDTAVDTSTLNYRDNSHFFELKSVTLAGQGDPTDK